MLSRRSLFLAAWILLLASVFVPAPAGLFPVDAAGMSGIKLLGEDILGGGGGVSGRWVIGKVVYWSREHPGTDAALGFWHVAALTLAFFANIAFFICTILHNCRQVSLACKIFLIAAVGISGSVALFFPVFARLPAYWLWLASLVVLAWAFIAFEGSGASRLATSARRADAGAGDVPLVVWMWLGFIAFWLTVTYIGASRFTTTASTEAKSDFPAAKALENYFSDQTNLIAPDKAVKLNAALAKFEKETSNQIAVAIYPRAPLGSIEEFTITTAERSRLGRKGLDNGAILFVFMNERSARLEVGYGLEGALTDIGAHHILEQRLKPAFARGDYAEGLDTALGAIFETVQDAYKQGRMPSELAVLWHQVRVASPKLVQQALPALTRLEFLPRFVISFFGGVFGTIACYVLREVVRTLYYLGRLARNFFAPRSGGAKIERVGFDAILEKLKLLGFALEVIVGSAGFALAAVASVAGIVIVAAGGGFGGAGALVRW
jgi:uncharacterized membrane protein YgcG